MKIFSQRDPQWKDQLVGFATKSTMGGYGCLVTCLAMIADYHGKDTNPELLNEALRRVKGFKAGTGYYFWKSLTKIYPDIFYTKMVKTPDPVTDAQFAEIDAHLAKGLLVVAHVDNKTPDGHFVLLLKKSHGGYDIADPWIGEVTRLATYGTACITVQRYILYQGPIEIHEEPAPLDAADQKVSAEVATEVGIIHFDEFNPTWTYKDLAYGFKEFVQKYNKIKGLPKELKECGLKVASAVEVARQLEKRIGTLQEELAEIPGLEEKIRNQKTQIGELQTALAYWKGKNATTGRDVIEWFLSKFARERDVSIQQGGEDNNG